MSISFRDPAGKLFFHQKQVFRLVNQVGKDDFEYALQSKKLKQFLELGRLVNFYQLDSKEAESLKEVVQNVFEIPSNHISSIVKHEKIPFLSYPYEWTPEMLHSAAELTLDLAEELQKEMIGLKDATPFNVLFRGAKPVFVDWLSFEKRDEFDPIWRSQAQFIRTFCLPLMVHKYLGFQLSWIFRVNRDGFEPEMVYQMLSLRKKLTPPFLSVVTIPKLLGATKMSTESAIYQKQTVNNAEKAQFILSQQFKSLRRLLKKIKPKSDIKSNWTDYVGERQHFTDSYFNQKQQFVESVLKEFQPKNVLDVGCNTGSFSRIAAQNGAQVIAIDQDAATVGKVWQMANQENLNILPLVIDISRPTAAIGWENKESASFLERVCGKVDCVLMLAVIHHLLVTERVPLSKILDLTAKITANIAIIEFVPPDDKMFKQISRGRDHLFEGLTEEVFYQTCQKYFKVLRSEKLTDSNRRILLLQK